MGKIVAKRIHETKPMPLNYSAPSEKENKNSNRTQLVLRYIFGYLLFFVFLILSAFLLFRLRTNLIQISFLLGYNQVQVKGISNLGVLIGGVLILSGIVFSEDYLRKGIQQADLWPRVLRLFLVEGGLILFSFALYYVLALIAV